MIKRRLLSIRENHPHFIYIFLPYLFSLILSILLFCFLSDFYKIEGFDKILESVINFSSIVIGFYTAMYGILISIKKNSVLKQFPIFNVDWLFKYKLYESLILSFIILIFTTLFQVLIYNENNFTLIYSYVWVFIVFIFLIISIQVMFLLLKILLSEPDQIRKPRSELNEEQNRLIKEIEEM